MRIKLLAILLTIALASIGCSKQESTETAQGKDTTEKPETALSTKPAPKPSPQDTTGQADYIVVQHLLIAFQGSVPGKPVTRSQDEAKVLAEELFERAKSGEDFDALISEYTDDSAPGIYKMANFGVATDAGQGVFARARMVRAFGDVGFPLEVGEFGLAEYDPQASQYGWHIIKRTE